MKFKLFTIAMMTSMGFSAAIAEGKAPSLKGVEFSGMAAPVSDEERAQAYTNASVIVTYSNGQQKISPLTYHTLFYTTDAIDGVTAGAVYDSKGKPFIDYSADVATPFVADTPDGQSLFQLKGAPKTGKGGHPLYLVTQYEYVTRDNAGNSTYGKLPMSMSLGTVDQNKLNGDLSVVKLRNIDMAGVGGLWIPCAASLSPWNTHLGSEEYEPDARKVAEGSLTLTWMNRYFDNNTSARPYLYGVLPEVTVKPNASVKVVKHYSMGRISRELAEIMPDQRTAYMGDDGQYTGLFMYVADRKANLSAGTLYAAKWQQLSDSNGGSARLSWIRLGHASDSEIARLANRLNFNDIFETATSDTPGFVQIKSNGNTEWLKVKPGMAKAAAFLETRRYAALLGATTEFNKMEGVAVNARDHKLYIAMSYIEHGMQAQQKDPADDIKLPGLKAGAVYELMLASKQSDASGAKIASAYVATRMAGLLLGEDITKDAAGNTANVEKIANPDNLKFSNKMRTLFIGEDSDSHVNNFVWAYHVDSGKLSRILSLPAGAEATGLQAIDNLNGYSYVMSSYQHPGDFSKHMDAALKARLEKRIDKKKAGVGYLGGWPKM